MVIDMKKIILNGIEWDIIKVPSKHPYLVDRSNVLTVGTTDPIIRTIFISESLTGDFEKRVVAHELGHAVCFSYGLLDEIHRCCKKSHWVEMEEFICNFVADYGEMIWDITRDITKVPLYLEKMMC